MTDNHAPQQREGGAQPRDLQRQGSSWPSGILAKYKSLLGGTAMKGNGADNYPRGLACRQEKEALTGRVVGQNARLITS